MQLSDSMERRCAAVSSAYDSRPDEFVNPLEILCAHHRDVILRVRALESAHVTRGWIKNDHLRSWHICPSCEYSSVPTGARRLLLLQREPFGRTAATSCLCDA